MPELSDESSCRGPLKSGVASAPATTWADRRGPSSSHPIAGGRPSLPMSPHGKRLWPEAARRERDTGTWTLVNNGLSVAVLARCVRGGRGTLGQLRLPACSLWLSPFRSSLSEGEGERSLGSTRSKPRHFASSARSSPRRNHSPGVSEGCRATYGNVDGLITPPCCHALGTLDFHLFPSAWRTQPFPHDPADPHGPRRGNHTARRVMEHQHHEAPTRRISPSS